MSTEHQAIIEGLLFIEEAMGGNVFGWNGENYPCIASIQDIKRELDTGGFVVDLMITITVRQYDQFGNSVFFNNVFPTAQQKITYNNVTYRILNVKSDSIGDNNGATGARLRIIGVSPNRGV